MKTVSIGIVRGDGDFALLATLNNNDYHMGEASFNALTSAVQAYLASMTQQEVIVLEREDAPDYVENWNK